jgi:hypothetical protein
MKNFTVTEALNTLPLVRKIVDDIISTGNDLKKLNIKPNEPTANNPEFLSLKEQLFFYINELEEIGCFYKDWNFTVGLVDFPAIFYGRQVFLCWRSDEPGIKFYHELDEGFTGRKPIPELYLNS